MLLPGSIFPGWGASMTDCSYDQLSQHRTILNDFAEKVGFGNFAFFVSWSGFSTKFTPPLGVKGWPILVTLGSKDSRRKWFKDPELEF